MPIQRAYALPHPPLALPEIDPGSERAIEKTIAAFDKVAGEIAALAPETIVFITPHHVVYADYFHISPGKTAEGDFARFRVPDTRFTVSYDTELAEAILAEADDLPVGYLGERDKRLDHGVLVPMWFINRRYEAYKAVRISQSGLDAAAHYRLGQAIAKAADKLGRKTILVASGDLSHKLSPSGPYGFAEEGPVFDKAITGIFDSADFLSLLTIPESLRERAAECGYRSYIVLAGLFDRLQVKAKLLSYEGPYGVGYAAASFSPVERDENRGILEQYTQIILNQAREHREQEDCYRALARRSLEYTVQNGDRLPLPKDLPEELLNGRAGVFVSLHKNGRLRGCIGTIAPTTEYIALEIIQNAVSAGFSDNRFAPVTAEELPFLTYKVDVLSLPARISGPEDLDVKRYGVIVSRGNKRGLLLPNLEGIETVAQQISVARQKGGIPENTPVTLERFEVIRHE